MDIDGSENKILSGPSRKTSGRLKVFRDSNSAINVPSIVLFPTLIAPGITFRVFVETVPRSSFLGTLSKKLLLAANV